MKYRENNLYQNSVIFKFNKFMYYFMLIVLIFVILFISKTHKLYNRDKIFYNISYISKSAGDIIIKAHTQTIVVPQGPPIKYILLWTTETAIPFLYLGKGQTVFKNKGCQWTNCYVTSDRNYLGFYTEFDVIAFNGPQLNTILHMKDLPARRSIHQKYVYANIESAANYPVANNVLDHYFNWTWTYKLNSDAIWGYFAVKNPYNEVIGPKTNMHWIDIDQMEPIDDNIKNRLKLKKRAAAMFSSNCLTLSRRERYVKKIQEELLKYKLELDIYGACGTHQCPRNIMDRCLNLLEKYYYFYFAFENAMSEDYVTEKIVYALNHFSVPVVFGGANYTRFMPDGIYLNALELGPERLAQRMNYIILNPSLYHSFFKWKKYYSFHFRNEDPSTDDYCNFCAMLNNERVNTTTVYLNLSSWWNDHRMYDSNNIDNKFISKDQNTELLDLP